MTAGNGGESAARILAPGSADSPPSRDAAWNVVVRSRARSRRHSIAVRAIGIAAVVVVAFALVWRSSIHEVTPRTAGVPESLRIIDASLRALREPPGGTTAARVMEENAYLLQLRGRVVAESDPLSESDE